MSGLFHHSVIDQKEGFVFLVAPRDHTSEYETELAKGLEEIIKEGWPSAPSQLTVAECNSEDEAELIYADIQTILEEAEEEEADNVVISSIVIVGDLCIVNCTLAGGDSEEEGDDSDDEEEEEDWE